MSSIQNMLLSGAKELQDALNIQNNPTIKATATPALAVGFIVEPVFTSCVTLIAASVHIGLPVMPLVGMDIDTDNNNVCLVAKKAPLTPQETDQIERGIKEIFINIMEIEKTIKNPEVEPEKRGKLTYSTFKAIDKIYTDLWGKDNDNQKIVFKSRVQNAESRLSKLQSQIINKLLNFNSKVVKKKVRFKEGNNQKYSYESGEETGILKKCKTKHSSVEQYDSSPVKEEKMALTEEISAQFDEIIKENLDLFPVIQEHVNKSNLNFLIVIREVAKALAKVRFELIHKHDEEGDRRIAQIDKALDNLNNFKQELQDARAMDKKEVAQLNSDPSPSTEKGVEETELKSVLANSVLAKALWEDKAELLAQGKNETDPEMAIINKTLNDLYKSKKKELQGAMD